MSLQKIGKYIEEYTKKNKNNDPYPVYSVTNSNGFCTDYFYKDVSGTNKTTYKIVPKGYFAYNPSRINVGSIDWQNREDNVIVSPLYVIFRCLSGLDQDYLKYFLKSSEGLRLINEKTCGSVRNNLKFKDLSKFEFNIVDVEDQRKIVSKLKLIESAIQNEKKQIELYDELINARFVEMFGTPITNVKGWKTEPMDKVAPTVNYSGNFGKEVWLLNLDMIEAQTGKIIDYLYVTEDEVGNSTCTFDTSNVLYSKLRPYLNKVVVPDRCGYATSELVPLQPVPSKLNREYLAYMLRSDEFVNVINEKVAGAKMPRVSMSDFRKFEVPIPSIELQNQFANYVKQVDKSKFVAKKRLSLYEELLKKKTYEYYIG